jgi:MYXO-CTERM domain-containing protein
VRKLSSVRRNVRLHWGFGRGVIQLRSLRDAPGVFPVVNLAWSGIGEGAELIVAFRGWGAAQATRCVCIARRSLSIEGRNTLMIRSISTLGLAACASCALAGGPSGTVINLGALTGDLVTNVNIAPNEVLWLQFSIPSGIASPDWLDVTTSGTATGIDTEIGLYDALGNRVANDDDNGIGLASTLSFGAGSGLMLGDAFNLGGDGLANGENGNIASAGTYYLAVGEFNVEFGDTGFDVVSTGTDTGGPVQVSFFTNVPTPGAFALLGLGGFAAARRRR